MNTERLRYRAIIAFGDRPAHSPADCALPPMRKSISNTRGIAVLLTIAFLTFEHRLFQRFVSIYFRAEWYLEKRSLETEFG